MLQSSPSQCLRWFWLCLWGCKRWLCRRNLMMMNSWWQWTVFVVWLTNERHLALFPAGNKAKRQRSSPSRISDTPQAGFEPAQNLICGFVEWRCAAVIRNSRTALTFAYQMDFWDKKKFGNWWQVLISKYNKIFGDGCYRFSKEYMLFVPTCKVLKRQNYEFWIVILEIKLQNCPIQTVRIWTHWKQ